MIYVLIYLNVYHYNLHVIMYSDSKYFVRLLIVYVNVNMQKISNNMFACVIMKKNSIFKYEMKIP